VMLQVYRNAQVGKTPGRIAYHQEYLRDIFGTVWQRLWTPVWSNGSAHEALMTWNDRRYRDRQRSF
jgi:hypothetical protein